MLKKKKILEKLLEIAFHFEVKNDFFFFLNLKQTLQK